MRGKRPEALSKVCPAKELRFESAKAEKKNHIAPHHAGDEGHHRRRVTSVRQTYKSVHPYDRLDRHTAITVGENNFSILRPNKSEAQLSLPPLAPYKISSVVDSLCASLHLMY